MANFRKYTFPTWHWRIGFHWIRLHQRVRFHWRWRGLEKSIFACLVLSPAATNLDEIIKNKNATFAESSICCWEEGLRLVGSAAFDADISWVADATASLAAFSSLKISFFFKALLAAALVAPHRSSAAFFSFSCSFLSLGFFAAP